MTTESGVSFQSQFQVKKRIEIICDIFFIRQYTAFAEYTKGPEEPYVLESHEENNRAHSNPQKTGLLGRHMSFIINLYSRGGKVSIWEEISNWLNVL